MATFCVRPNLSEHHFTLYDRVSKLLESFEWSDVTFVVGEEIIKAHKLILAISSPVFKVMLYGPLAEQREIIISDIEPQIFQLLIDFIYKDKVVIDKLEVACGLLYAAKKYMLPYLSEVCVKYIQNCMSVTNVLSIYNFSEWIQEPVLIKDSLSLVCRHADVILQTYSYHINEACLLNILKESSVNISERGLIEFAWAWTHNECLRANTYPSNQNRHQLLIKCGVFDNLRFLSLSKDDFNWLRGLGILLPEEINAIEHNVYESQEQMHDERKFPFFNLNEDRSIRKALPFEWMFCHRHAIRSTKPLVIGPEGVSMTQSVKINLKCQRTVFVGGLLVSSRQSLNVFHKESVVDSYLENIVINFSSCNSNEGSLCIPFSKVVEYNSTMLIKFPKPAIMLEDESYTISVSWPGKKTQMFRYPLSYRPSCTAHALAAFTFEDNSEAIGGSLFEGLMFCI